jgi:hypothetical protein
MIQVESALRHSRTPSDHLVRRRRHGHPMIGSLAVTFRGKSPAGSWVRMDFCCTVVKRKFEDRTCARPQRRRRCRSRRLGRRHRRRRHPLPPRRTGAGAALARARRAGASTDPSLSPAARGKRDGVVNRLLASLRPTGRLMLIKLVCLNLNLNRRHGHHCRQKPVPAA